MGGLGWILLTLLSTTLLVGVVAVGALLVRRDRARQGLARRDPLTGLSNRTQLTEVADRLLSRLDTETATAVEDPR